MTQASATQKFYKIIATDHNGATVEIFRAGEGGYLIRNARTGEYNYTTGDILNRIHIINIILK